MNITKPLCLQEGRVSSEQVYALKALSQGEADPYQQKLALKTIVDNFCGTYQRSFLPGKPDETVFMQGRAFPGQRIFHHINLDPTEIKQLKDEEKNHA